MKNHLNLENMLHSVGLSPWVETVKLRMESLLSGQLHGDSNAWLTALTNMPQATPTKITLNKNAIEIGQTDDLDSAMHQDLLTNLQKLKPWRKGPFNLFGHYIDSEWQSNYKWDIVAQATGCMQGKKILDVGCGNGYYMLRMLGAEAEAVLGIEPMVLSILQFQALTKYLHIPAWIIPFRLEDIPGPATFDMVFSMGVLTHSKAPLKHLTLLQKPLRPAGKLLLETIVIPESYGTLLRPRSTYARMRNIWYLPSPKILSEWLSAAGFVDIELCQISPPNSSEQRRTEWMPFESLEKSLNPNNHSQTIEGYPAPLRALFKAIKPDN